MCARVRAHACVCVRVCVWEYNTKQIVLRGVELVPDQTDHIDQGKVTHTCNIECNAVRIENDGEGMGHSYDVPYR